MANGQLEKLPAAVALKFDIGDHTFAEHSVVMKNLTGPIMGLHFMRHKIVLIDLTHGLVDLLLLTMQIKSAKNEVSVQPQAVIFDDTLKTSQQKQSQLLLITQQSGKQKEMRHLWDNYRKQPVCWSHNQCQHFMTKSSNQSKKYNGITSRNQKAYTICRVLRCYSGAIQVQ